MGGQAGYELPLAAGFPETDPLVAWRSRVAWSKPPERRLRLRAAGARAFQPDRENQTLRLIRGV